MLSYIVFCCGLLYVQANENNSVVEIIDTTNKLLNENFETCDCGRTNSCLCLPNSRAGCELPCFVEGFKRMYQTLQVNAKVKEKIHFGRRLLSQRFQLLCANKYITSLLCKVPCDSNSTVTVKEFLTVVQTTFQQVNKEKARKIC